MMLNSGFGHCGGCWDRGFTGVQRDEVWLEAQLMV